MYYCQSRDFIATLQQMTMRLLISYPLFGAAKTRSFANFKLKSLRASLLFNLLYIPSEVISGSYVTQITHPFIREVTKWVPAKQILLIYSSLIYSILTLFNIQFNIQYSNLVSNESARKFLIIYKA